MARITRLSFHQTDVTVTNDVATTTEIDMTEYASGVIFIPSGTALTILTYHVAPTPGGTYVPLCDKNGNAVTQTVTGGDKALPIHEATFGARAIKLVDAAETATIEYSLKG